MNDFHDPLESELAALRPREPSPELAERIGERLNRANEPLSRRPKAAYRPWAAGLSVALAVTAACAFVALVLPRGGDGPPVAEHPDAEAFEAPQPLVASAFDETLPTLWQYRTAISRSPNELDAVLDKHSLPNSEPKPQRARNYAFSRFHPEADPLGEL